MKRFMYFSNSHNLDSLLSQSKSSFHAPIFLPKTLVSHEPSSSNFLDSNQFCSKSAFHPRNSLISPNGSSSVCTLAPPSCQNSQSLHLYKSGGRLWLNLCLLRGRIHGRFRSFSNASLDVKSSTVSGASGSDENGGFENVGIDGFRPNASSNHVLEIIDMVRKGESDLKSKLDSMNVRLSIASIAQIFQVLNGEKVSALGLYDWIRDSQPESVYRNDVCSLAIDNCGRLEDYSAVLGILNDIRSMPICLTQKAFGFISSSSSVEASVIKVVEVLKEVGEPCLASGVLSLIEMFSARGSFSMAKFVMNITEVKRSYYTIMVKAKCKRRDFGGAMAMLDEMRLVGCDPDVKVYNCLLSSLCKCYKSAEATRLLEKMQERNCPPDEITYEIFICYSCKVGKFDLASKLLDKMELTGIKPRLSTHAAFIKGYFYLRRYKEAYKYVVDSGARYSYFSNAVYSMLAKLYIKEGNVVLAKNILIEMIDMGMKPNSPVYAKVLKHLSQTGRTGLAEDLESRFSSLGGGG